jgi:hypothetical protein
MVAHEPYLLLQGFVALLYCTQLPCALLQAQLARVFAHTLRCKQTLQLCRQQQRAARTHVHIQLLSFTVKVQYTS